MKNRNLDHKNDWKTPDSLFEFLHEYDYLDRDYFDPCPFMHDINKWDGLKINWPNGDNFINPPYSLKEKEAFVKKTIEESKKGRHCVMLLPVSTSTKLFHDHILPNQQEILFLKGRVKFSGRNSKGEWVTDKCGMHDSMIVIF